MSVSVSKFISKIPIKLVISIYSAYKSTVVSVTMFPSVRELPCENDLQVITANSLLTHPNRKFFSFTLCLAIGVISNTAAILEKSRCLFCGYTQLKKKKNDQSSHLSKGQEHISPLNFSVKETTSWCARTS